MICKYILCAAEIQCKSVGQNLPAAGICILTVAPKPVWPAGRFELIPQSGDLEKYKYNYKHRYKYKYSQNWFGLQDDSSLSRKA